MSRSDRRFPVGPEVQPDGSTHFRVWAPRPREVRLVIEDANGERVLSLDDEGDGYFSTRASDVAAGTRYGYRLDGRLYADPASRFQPDGPLGASQVVDGARYRWNDAGWRGITREGQVLYEMHVGTFTAEGTWQAAMERLPLVREIGITAVEVMPVSEFAGEFGWGYDGVFPYAPTRLYGTPDDFRAFVDRAHAVGLGVILDVVYNHLGPSGCIFREYSEAYFTDRYENEWGEPLNFDGPGAAPVRDYFIGNAAYWIAEFHLDGLRLDAVHSMYDRSRDHITAAVTDRAREAARGRSILVIAESEQQKSHALRPRDRGGFGLDAAWNDDFHHSAVVALTGHTEAYYSDHRGSPQEFISAAKYGYLFQGQRYAWQKRPRGSRTDGIPPGAFVNFLENHDQLANSDDGSRLHQRADAGRYRAMTSFLLLMPGIPMLFQGQEFCASTPFLYFADHDGELADAVRKGRADFVAQFRSLATPQAQARLPAPDDPATFEACKLRWQERVEHAPQLRLHADLLALRREMTCAAGECSAIDGAVLSEDAFVLRYSAAVPGGERLLLVNLGPDLLAGSFPEPLVAPPDGFEWRMRWSSEAPEYGGVGAYDVVTSDGWRVPGHAAVVLASAFASDASADKPVERRDGGSERR